MYPSEHVVRWLASLRPESEILDIGCGSGRHMIAADDMGHFVEGCDASPVAVAETRNWFSSPEYVNAGWNHAEIVVAEAQSLPFESESFDAALAYGVFYYGTRQQHAQAISEMHRVLKPGGHGFVCERDIWDWRYRGILEGDPEYGMDIDFIHYDDVPVLYQAFSRVSFETSEWTTDGRTMLNSDILVTVQK